MQLIGQIDSQEINVKEGTATRSGKPYSIREQSILVAFPSGERRRLSLSLEANEQPLPNGTYEPRDTAAYAEKFGIAVSMRARHWQAVKAAGK